MSEHFQCSICLDFASEYPSSDYFVSTKGGHIFHYLCIRKLIKNGILKCPLCEEDISLNTLIRLYGFNPNSVIKESNVKDTQYDYMFKIVVIGESGVGKTCLMKSYLDEIFVPEDLRTVATIGCDIRLKTIEIGGQKIKLNIWDSGGQEKYQSMSRNFIRNAQGVLIVYDVTNVGTFEAIGKWLNFANTDGLLESAKVLVGNKTDLEEDRQVTPYWGISLAEKLGISYFETTAKDKYKVEAAFRTLVAEILSKPELCSKPDRNVNLNPNNSCAPPDYFPLCDC